MPQHSGRLEFGIEVIFEVLKHGKLLFNEFDYCLNFS